MQVENGMFYRKTDTGELLQVQTEKGGTLAAYDVRGYQHFSVAPGDHVHGLEPAGMNDWKQAREAHLQERAKAKRPRKKSKKKVEQPKVVKEEGEGAQ